MNLDSRRAVPGYVGMILALIDRDEDALRFAMEMRGLPSVRLAVKPGD
jgi:hypothetical protein